jgi:outer membrane protein TolC
MVGRSAGLPILLVVLLIAGTVTGRAAAQAPAPPAASPGTRRNEPAAGALPSTVSPAIAQFIRRNGLDRPPPPNGSPLATIPARRPIPPPPPPLRLPSLDTRALHALREAPPALRRPALLAQADAPDGDRASPLAYDLTLRPSPLEPSDLRFPINLATALRLADARPLIVAAAQASVWVAEAELTRAKLLWVPTVRFGFDYLRHDGGGPDFNKGIMTAPSVNYFFAGGAANLFVNLTDAYFEPLVARQTLNAAHWTIQAAKNDAVLQVAEAYFRVHQYRGNYAGHLYCVHRGKDLVERVEQLGAELVPKVEVDRARNMLAELELRATRARRGWRVASADLTEVLRLDPRAVVVPLEHDHAQLTLIDPGRPLDELMPVALANRPELASQQARVLAAELGIRREKMRPLLPIAAITGFQHPTMYLQGGIFALGPNSSLDQWTGRSDVSLQLVWQLEGFGIGNLARIKRQRGLESQAIVDLRRTQDTVAADVLRALARVQAAAAQVHQADRGLRAAIITFNGQLEGLGETRRLGDTLYLVFRPQEAVYSLEQMSDSFSEYFATVAEYNRAQFNLFHALGYPAAEISALRSPGAIRPVNTDRPSYLPPVGNGPPPATR